MSSSDEYDPDYAADGDTDGDTDDMDDTDASLIDEDYVPPHHEPFYEAKDTLFRGDITSDGLNELGQLKLDIERQYGDKIEHNLDEWLACASVDDMHPAEIVKMFESYDNPRTRAPLRSLFGADARGMFAETVSSHGLLPVHKQVLSPKVLVEMLLERIDRFIAGSASMEAVDALSAYAQKYIDA